jgi:hypothetical protein
LALNAGGALICRLISPAVRFRRRRERGDERFVAREEELDASAVAGERRRAVGLVLGAVERLVRLPGLFVLRSFAARRSLPALPPNLP